ncbi:MAG: AMP-binding protein, partial [Oscillospiraceae bacterium]|nr:AMP-binding protein [Oscillospiraceae bacterium]
MKLFAFANQNPEAILARCGAGETLRYGEIGKAEALLARQTGRALIFLLCRNTPGTLLTYLGAIKGPAVPLLPDAAAPAELLKPLAERYRPAWLALPEDLAAKAAALCPAAEERGRVRDCVLLRTGWEGPALDEGLKLLLTTSGSTGSPKLVRLSAKNLDANALSIAQYLEIDRDERPLASLPMHYSYGMSVIHSHVLTGAALLLTSRTVLEREFWRFAEAEGATSFAGVPYTYEMMDRLRMRELFPDSLRTLTKAGGHLREDLQRRYAGWCRDTGRRFFVMYGQTEASPRMSYLSPALSLEKCGGIGCAVPGGRLSLIDESGGEITAAGRTGELVYEGDNVCLGYAQTREDLLRGDENRGRLYTGDLAWRDAEGCYFLAGRKSRFLKLAGKRFSLDRLEQLLEE